MPLQLGVRQSADHAVDLEHAEGRRDHRAWSAASWPSPSATRSTARRSPGRRSIDLLSTIPVAIPGLVVGVAYLWAWIGLPGGLYGTIWILALAFVARFIPDTVKALSTSFMQIHKELEEAAWICGRGLLGTIATIVLPLARPGVVASMTLLFVLAVRELGLVALPLHQRHDRDGRAAARLLRGRQHRQDRRLQPGADA